MKDKASIHDCLNEFNSLVNELLRTSVKVDEEKQTTLLLCSILDL